METHHTNKNDDDTIIAAKIIVYAGEFDQYYSFVMTEEYNSLKIWMDYREFYGQKITDESWLMRNLWKTTNMKYGSKNGISSASKTAQKQWSKKLGR